MKAKLVITLTLSFVIHAYADSATWNLNPISDDWDTAENWTPNTIPDGPDDDATFNQSNITSVVVPATEEVRSLIFAPGADQFTITVNGHRNFFIVSGIVNDSAVNQTLVALADPSGVSGTIVFDSSSTSGTMMTIITEGNSVANLGNGGLVIFNSSSTAAANTFFNLGATVDGGFGGRIIFNTGARAADSTITNDGGTVAGANGGFTSFEAGGHAGNAVITAAGATVPDAFGGVILLADGADAGAAALIATGGTNGGRGGRVFLGDISGSAQVEVNGNGILDVGRKPSHPSRVGSLEGDGIVKLSAHDSLEIGNNNVSTTFSGTIQNSGSIIKTGTGTLTLNGANTYSGRTTVTSGILLVSNASGSGTGTGAMSVNAGTLGGSGIISGAVTVGTNTGVQAFLAPSKGVRIPATLTIQGALTLNDDSTYLYKLDTETVTADEVIANGVVIDSGAKFSLRSSGNNALTLGEVFTVINNTSATPIAGTFHNLADGQIISVNGSNLQASYSGGDGNDLTLTVVP
jgi:autotransporter-associated beta strand protein